MRVKQTARKSTTTKAMEAQMRSSGSSGRVDPVRTAINNILQAKRKSATPGMSSNCSGSGVGLGIGKGKGKYIAGAVKIKPRAKAGALALKEIKKLRKGYEMLIPRAPFHRLVREITQNISDELGVDYQFSYQVASLEALQEAAEAYIVRLFENANLCTIHAKRVTLFTQDIALCLKLQRNWN